MRALLLCLGLILSSMLAQRAGAAPPDPVKSSPVKPGQTWVLKGTAASGEQFQTALKLSQQVPKSQPLTYRADRGTLLYDPGVPSLVVLDTADARGGGLALACVTRGQVAANSRIPRPGVLVSGTLPEVAARLEDAFAVASVTRTPAQLKAATAELRLGTCTLTRR